MKAPEVSCFIPAFNEARTIAQTLDSLTRNLAELYDGFEVVVVDDNSVDETVGRVEAMADPRIRVTESPRGPSFRENVGQSMKTARGSLVMLCDADLLPDIPTLKRLFWSVRDGHDIAVGNRYHPDSDARRKVSRRVLSLAYNRFLHLAYTSPIMDHQCGLKVFRRDVLQDVFEKMEPDPHYTRGWFWDAELLIRARWSGYRVVEVPVTWQCRLDSRSMLWKQYRMIPWMRSLHADRPR